MKITSFYFVVLPWTGLIYYEWKSEIRNSETGVQHRKKSSRLGTGVLVPHGLPSPVYITGRYQRPPYTTR